MSTTPKGLLGWTTLRIVSDVNAYDPGIVHTESYKGEAFNTDLALGQSLYSLIDSKWWCSSVCPRYHSLKLIDADAESATLLYGDKEIRITVNLTKKIDTIPLDYADSSLYVSILKQYKNEALTTEYDVFTLEQYEKIKQEADAGNADAINHLAYISYYGVPRLSIPSDKLRAHQLWEQAAQKGNAPALYCLSVDLYEGGDGIEKDIPRSLDCLIQAADKGNIKACARLGDIYFCGEDEVLAQDRQKAFHYYQIAAQEEHQAAKATLGMMYFDGVGAEQDYKKAFEIFSDTAYSENNWACSWSCYYMGEFYRCALGDVKKDLKEAFRFYEHAAELGNPDALSQLGVMYSMGWGCKMNMSAAVENWEKALEQNNAAAAYYLALYYEDADWGNDPEKADEYQQRAAQLGDEDAEREIELGLRPGEKPEKEVEEDMVSKVDYEALLKDSMSNPTEHARVIWRGVKDGDSECMRRYLYVAYNCQAEDEIDIVAGWLADREDERALLYKQIRKNVADSTPLSAYCMAFFDKEGSPYASLYGEMIYTLCRLHVNRVGFFEDDVETEGGCRTDPPDEETVKYWYSLYNRSDCSSNQIGIYRDALPYAKGGNADAQFIVGYLLLNGIKTKYSSPNTVYLEPNKEEAKQYLLRAAEQGIAKAYRQLPHTCEYGSDEWLGYIKKGVELDIADNMEILQDWLSKHGEEQEAARLCLKRAEKGNHKAMLEMARRYETGDGVEQNPEEAFRLADYVYQHSSISPYDSSYEDAAELLQRYYTKGIGVDPNPDKAWQIFSILKDEEERLDDLLSR